MTFKLSDEVYICKAKCKCKSYNQEDVKEFIRLLIKSIELNGGKKLIPKEKVFIAIKLLAGDELI